MSAHDDPMTNPAAPRILFVEDVAADAELVTQALRREGIAATVRRVDSEAGLVRALAEFVPDVILSDHSLPQFSAADTLRIVARDTPSTPVIVVTGSLNEETAADYIKAGAADYFLKTKLSRLPAAGPPAPDPRPP